MQNTLKPSGRARRGHRYPRCPITGKVRLGERKDARLVLEYVRRCAQADIARGVVSRRQECRSYRCPACRGWHLTSQEANTRHGSSDHRINDSR